MSWFSAQDLTIVFEQSNDGVTVHQSDTFYYRANSTGQDSSSVINLMNNYHRVKITNSGSGATTTLYANTYNCPNILTYPRSLTRAGNFKVEIPEKATYRACFSGTPVATATFTIKGSATKVIKITKFGFSQSGTASSFLDVFVKKYSSIVTGGGASATITGVPIDSRTSAATAVVQNWTTTPGTQTSVGTVDAVRYRSAVAADNIVVTEKIFEFGWNACLASQSAELSSNPLQSPTMSQFASKADYEAAMQSQAQQESRNWKEDYADGDNMYQCTCSICESKFYGYKRRVVCKVCDASQAQQTESQEASDTKNAERKNWTTKDWMSHVGAWETDRDTIEFGSVMAVNAMLIQFQQFMLWQIEQQEQKSLCEYKTLLSDIQGLINSSEGVQGFIKTVK